MQNFKRLSRDTRLQEQPEGTIPFGKNGIVNYVKNAVYNEPGFIPSASVIPYKYNGVIETDKYPIIFSTNDVNSAIGFYNPDEDTYIPILNDATLPFKLGFKVANFITGQVQRNYKGELVGAFTDKVLNPFYLNFDNPQVTSLQDMLLFPGTQSPTVNIALTSGGTLLPGAYYVAVKLLKNDGTETAYLTVSAPQIVSGTTNTVTDKAIQVSVSQIDTEYELVQLAIIRKTNGVTSVVQLASPITASANLTYIYTGNELSEDITLEEVLIAPAHYTRVETIGQLNDALYITGLDSEPEERLQKYVNKIRLKWHSSLLTISPASDDLKNSKEKTFMHDEVGAFYIRFRKTSGGFTKNFHIPGPALTSDQKSPSTVATAEGLVASKFQVDDIITVFDAASKSGYCSGYANASETYPNTDDYNSSAVGGEDLRNQPVRHHRFPSIQWCKDNLYSGNPAYGKTALDKLGISVENIVLPNKYASAFNGYEILYAKRNIANSTVLGQSLLLFGARAKGQTEFSPANFYSTGGNFHSEINYKSGGDTLYVDQSIFHLHPFDTLYNRPAVKPDYLSLQLQLKREPLTTTPNQNSGSFIEDGGPDQDRGTVFLFDYITSGLTPTSPTKKLKAVKDTQYVPNHVEIGKWKNKGIETFFGGRITNPEALIASGNVDTNQVWTDRGRRKGVTTETTFLTNMKAIRSNVYLPFTGQSLVRAGVSPSLTASPVLYGGDSFISDYTFHTYGSWSFAYGGDNESQNKTGTITVRRFICETASNLYSRFEDAANPYSRYYPVSTLAPGDPSNYTRTWIRSSDPNQFGYSKDSNALDDLISTSIFDTYVESVTSHPYRIHRGGKLSRQTKFRSWKTFLPLDYYEMQKNMGRPVNLEGMDDRLLIHCENALFLTQDKAKLESDLIGVTLGSGDIFRFEPQEGLSAKLGYAGTQHQLACVRTPFGYVFIDSDQGQLFLYKGTPKLINNWMNTFFQQYLRLKEINVFNGNGYTIGYDPQFKRLLLTVKNRRLASGADVPTYTDSMLPTLETGDIVYKDGRMQRFLGINNPGTTLVNCEVPSAGSISNFTATIPETTAVGTVIGNVGGTHVKDRFLSGDTTPFSMNAAGAISVTSPLDYYKQNTYNFTGGATGDDGAPVTFSVTINVTLVASAPTLGDGEVTILDTAINNDELFTAVGVSRGGLAIAYAITAGNDGAFSINSSTGVVKVADASKLDGINKPRYDLTITATTTEGTGTATLIVHVLHVNRPPVPSNLEITILDTTATGAEVLVLDTDGLDLEKDPLSFVLVDQTVPGVFQFNPATLTIKLVNNSLLDPSVKAVHVLQMTVSDPYHNPVPFTVTINVKYDRASVAFEPATPSCTGSAPTCAPGYTLSPDQTTCTKVTTTPAASSGGSGIGLQHYSYSQYSLWGSIIYPEGTYGNDGAVNQKVDTSLILASAPLFGYKPVGESTYAGSLWGNPTSGTAQDGTTGRLNRTGVWKQGSQVYMGELGFSRQFNIPATGKYLIGVGADDAATIKINGVTIVSQNLTAINASFNTYYAAGVAGTADLFRYWHVYEMTLNAGVNIISVSSNNTGSIGLIGVEVYSATITQLKALTNESELAPYIIFSSAKPAFGSVDDGDFSDIGTYNCDAHPGYVLVYDPATSAYSCRLIETATPTPGTSTRAWAQIAVRDVRLSKLIQYKDNLNLTPKAKFQDIDVPYYAPVLNHLDCGGTVVSFLNAAKSGSAQKLNCTTGTGSIVKYTVPAGSYMQTDSQASVDAIAQTEADANKQSYANTNGTCS